LSDVLSGGGIASTRLDQTRKNYPKALIFRYKFAILVNKILKRVKTLFIEENSSVESVDPDGCLTPFPPVLSENGDHFLLEFQNGEKYIILSSEDAEFLKKFIEKFDQLYTLQNQMIRNDFNTTYDFACKTASKLKITIEKPSHKKSEKAIASDFWTKQVTKYLDYLIDEGKRAEVILSKLKTENKFLKENRSSANPRKNLKYPLGDSEILIEFQEFINASVEECIDTAGAINKPNLELSRIKDPRRKQRGIRYSNRTVCFRI